MGVEDILGSSRKVEDVGDDHFWTDLRVEFYYVVITLKAVFGEEEIEFVLSLIHI